MGAGRGLPNPLDRLEPLADGAAAPVAGVFERGVGVRRPKAILHAPQNARIARYTPGSESVERAGRPPSSTVTPSPNVPIPPWAGSRRLVG
jgi:hypothetical protein